jgi:hypothetical protein
MAVATSTDDNQVEKANASGLMPVVFVHGLWLLPSSWDRWATVFEEAGYTALTPKWPDDPDTVADANEAPEVLRARPSVDGHHFAEVIGKLEEAGRGGSLLRRPLDADRRSRLVRGVRRDRPGAVSRRALHRSRSTPRRRCSPTPRIAIAQCRSPDQFRWVRKRRHRGQAKELYETFAVPASGRRLQAASAPESMDRAKVDTKSRARSMLIISGRRTTPFRGRSRTRRTKQAATRGVTEITRCEPRACTDDRQRLARGRRPASPSFATSASRDSL